MALFPPWASLHTYPDVDAVQRHYSVGNDVWSAVTNVLGDPGADLRLFAAVPQPALVHAIHQARLPAGDSLSAINATQVGLMWRLARRVMAFQGGTAEINFEDTDPWKSSTGDTGRASDGKGEDKGHGGGSSVKEKVLKMSSLIDQMDESELLPPDIKTVNKWHAQYIRVMGSMPDESEEPSAGQLAGLAKRMDGGGPPYVDFAVFLPYGRRSEKSHKFRTYVPLGNGEIQVKEQPGPSNFQAWLSSWRVFKCACIMLDILNLASLSRYEAAIEKMVRQWPSAWGLICSAEDKARSERWMRLHRRTLSDRDTGRQVPHDWTEERPWSSLLTMLTADYEFWSEQVHVPAAAWLANGQRGAPKVSTEDAILDHLPVGTYESDKDPGGGDRKKQANRDRRAAKRKRIAEEREELRKLRKDQSSGGGGKSGGKGKSKDQAGEPLCYSWAGKFGPCKDIPPGGKCACNIKRAHKCRKCLSPAHQDADCPGAK